MALLWLLLACKVTSYTVASDCDPRTLEPGEVRVRRVPCTDELPADGEGRRGDWILENAVLRAVIRHQGDTLTRLGRAGGTVVDLLAPDGVDGVAEIVPLLDEDWFVEAAVESFVEEDAAGLRVHGVLPAGGRATVSWRLAADSPLLELSGADVLEAVPLAGAEVVGDTFEIEGAVTASDGQLTDEGGWIRWDEAGLLAAGDRERVTAALWPERIAVSGTATAEWVEARSSGETLTRLPVEDGSFAGEVPATTDALVAVAPGRADSAGLPGEGVALAAGEAGALRVRLSAEDGTLLPGTLWWGGEPWPLDPGGGLAPVGPSEGDAWVSAGPAWEAQLFRDLVVEGEIELHAVLRPAVDPAVLARIGLESWPDRDTRTDDRTLVGLAAGQGVGFAVATADDEVARAEVDPVLAPWIALRNGSRAATTDLGRPLAWPWSTTTKQAAHGAAAWEGLGAGDLLAVLQGKDDRFTVIDADWVAAAGTPWAYDPVPAAFLARSLDDLGVYASLLDAWLPVAVLGELTWIDGLAADRWSAVDAEAMLVEGRTTATNGPRILLDLDGAGPGDAVEADFLVAGRLKVQAPAYVPLSGAALVGPGGTVLRSWSMDGHDATRLDTDFVVPPAAWMLAIAWGEAANPPLLDEPAWAVTSPVWLQHP